MAYRDHNGGVTRTKLVRERKRHNKGRRSLGRVLGCNVSWTVWQWYRMRAICAEQTKP